MRQYVNQEQFRELVKGLPPTEALTKNDNLIVMRPSITEVKALGGHDSRLIQFKITDETVDRMSDVLKIDGWMTENFEANPVVLFGHSHYDPPVGKAVTLDVQKRKKQILSVTEFTPKDLYPMGYMMYQMYLKGFMNAVSVGFQPLEYAFVSSETDAERARKAGIDFLKHDLLEYSAVPVPANPKALVEAKGLGIDVAPLKKWAEDILDESSSRNLSDDARRRLEVLRSAASTGGRALILEIGEMKMALPKELPQGSDSGTTNEAKGEKSSPVKKVVTESWSCGTDGHSHASESEANKCIQFDESLEEAVKAVGGVTAVIKAGRVLSKKNETALRSAVEQLTGVLAQLDKADEEEEDDEEDKETDEEDEEDKDDSEDEEDDEEDDDDEKGIVLPEMSVKQVNGLVRDALADGLKKFTGRIPD